MNQSDTVKEIFGALAKAQSEFPQIPKTKEVIVATQRGNFAFKYSPLEETIRLIRPVLAKNGLGFTQGTNGETLVTTVFHQSGEWFSHSMPLTDIPSAQQYGSQLTYRRRYSLKAALGIETDEDDADNQYTDDGKKKKITPNAGAFDGVPKERHGDLIRHAHGIVDYFNNGQEEEAYKMWLEVTDKEEKLAVWSYLDSKQRKFIKGKDAERSK